MNSAQTMTDDPLAAIYTDSLPYIDTDYDNDKQLRTNVISLIQQELQQNTKRRFKKYMEDVDAQYPTKQLFSTTQFFKDDLARYTQTEQLPQRINHEQRYTFEGLPPIPTTRANMTQQDWLDLLRRYYASLEHHTKHQLHLQLLMRFGKNAWQKAIETTNHYNTVLTTTVSTIQNNIEYINKQRKYQQDTVRDALQGMTAETYELIENNIELYDEIFLNQFKSQYKIPQDNNEVNMMSDDNTIDTTTKNIRPRSDAGDDDLLNDHITKKQRTD